MVQNYSEEDKMKYVRGFKNCTLTPMEYANKMQIRVSDLRHWLKEYPNLPGFGTIQINHVVAEASVEALVPAPVVSTPEVTPKTILQFDNGTIKIEIKENYSKELLSSLTEVFLKC